MKKFQFFSHDLAVDLGTSNVLIYTDGKGVTIRNNVFDCSARNLVYWSGKDYTSGLSISGNSFYQKTNDDGKAIRFGKVGQKMATNQAELETAVRIFDPTAKVVKWLG